MTTLLANNTPSHTGACRESLSPALWMAEEEVVRSLSSFGVSPPGHSGSQTIPFPTKLTFLEFPCYLQPKAFYLLQWSPEFLNFDWSDKRAHSSEAVNNLSVTEELTAWRRQESITLPGNVLIHATVWGNGSKHSHLTWESFQLSSTHTQDLSLMNNKCLWGWFGCVDFEDALCSFRQQGVFSDEEACRLSLLNVLPSRCRQLMPPPSRLLLIWLPQRLDSSYLMGFWQPLVEVDNSHY